MHNGFFCVHCVATLGHPQILGPFGATDGPEALVGQGRRQVHIHLCVIVVPNNRVKPIVSTQNLYYVKLNTT